MVIGLWVGAASASATDIRTVLAAERPAPPPSVDYRYVLDVTAHYGNFEDPPETATATIAVDATRPPGARATVLSRDDDSKDLTKMIDGVIEGLEDEDNTPERMAQSFYCTLDAQGFDVAEDTEAHAVLKPDASSMAIAMARNNGEEGEGGRLIRRLSERRDGEIVVAKPSGQIVSSAFRMTRPMTVMLVAKIHSMEITQDCVPAPDGFMRSERFAMTSDVSALGKEMRTAMTMRVRDLEPVAP